MAHKHYPRLPQGGPVVIPNCSEVKLVWTQNGMKLNNVFHGALTVAGPLNPAVAETIFSAIKAANGTTTWMGHLFTGISLSEVHVKDLRAANNPTLVSTGLALPGTGTGTALPQDNALVVTLLTAFSGKGYVGRVYLPGLDSLQLADSRHWISTAGFDNAALGFCNAVNSAMTASGMPWVLGRRKLLANSDPAAPPPYNQNREADTIPITGPKITDHRIDSQRKRLGR
jgi:hypothetical protein